jgi:hypothetical protein
MSTTASLDEFKGSSSQSKHTVQEPASSRTYDDDDALWVRNASLSETNKFASLFFLFNDFEFKDCNNVAVALVQAKKSSIKCDELRNMCFVAIQFLCKKKHCTEFLNTCSTILDKFTRMKSNTLGDYLRHAQWKRLSSILPLEAFQETVVIDLIENFDILIQNRHIVLQDWESRTLCRFLVHFYKCMLLYMYLLKEQEKLMRAKQLKSVLDKRRQGRRSSLETSIAPLFDPNFEVFEKVDVIFGGQEFMNCMKSEEHVQFDDHRDKNLASCFFCIWSRRTSFKRLSISAIVHSLMKLLRQYCRSWAYYVSKSKASKIFHRVCRGHINKKRQLLVAAVFQKWRQLTKVSEKFAKVVSQKAVRTFKNWIQITAMHKRFVVALQKRLISSRKRLIMRSFECWRGFVASKISNAKLIFNWSAHLSEKISQSASKAFFQGWKRWYLARWIAKSYMVRCCKTRALNAWIEYQILFIQKMITCATRVRLLIDSNCVDSHFLKWKMRTASKRNIQLTVIIQKMRISLRMWNRKCGFGIFKSGLIMTACAFCFNRWKKVTKLLLMNRRTWGHCLELWQKKMRCKTYLGVWNDSVILQRSLKEKVASSLFSKMHLFMSFAA